VRNRALSGKLLLIESSLCLLPRRRRTFVRMRLPGCHAQALPPGAVLRRLPIFGQHQDSRLPAMIIHQADEGRFSAVDAAFVPQRRQNNN
jgi:hypothetical protein